MKLKSKRAQKNERVIYLWSIPANGHLNPTLCFTNQLLLRLDELNVSRIVFYSGRAFRDLILNLPNNVDKRRIEFRDYGLEQHTGTDDLLKILMNFDTRPGTLFRVFQCFENSVKLGSKHLFKNLIRDIHIDKPVLILYDQALFFPKLALDLYAKKYNCPKPLHACYVTTFMCAKGVYPYWSELEKMGLLGNNLHLHNKIRTFMITMYDFCKYVFTYYKTLWWDLGFTLVDLFLKCDLPISKYHLIDENLNMVFVMPEVQPRLEFFRKDNIKFVGPSVDESVRKNILKEKIDMEKYVAIIDKYLEKNLLKDINDNESMLSEYLSSAGLARPGPIAQATTTDTIASPANNSTQPPIANSPVEDQVNTSISNAPLGLNQSFSFQTEEEFHKSILQRAESTGENFKKLFKPIIYVSMGTVFNNENSHLFTILVEACECFTDKYAVIVSTGDEKTLQKYANTPLHSRGNILMVPHTPQVEILKRAHLFITHAGMNSVSEAVNYGVPIICLPLSGDQPFVAWRVADELRLGIRLQPDSTLNVERVKSTIETILNDPTYRQRAQEYSNISKTYAGHKTACDITVQFVKENELREYKSLMSASPKHRRRQRNTAAANAAAAATNNTTPQSEQLTHLIDNENNATNGEKDETAVIIKSKKKNKLFGGFGSKKK